MRIFKYVLSILATAQFTTAFYIWIPDYRCEESDGCSASPKSDIASREAKSSLRLVQRLPNANIPRDDQIHQLAERLTQKYNRATRVTEIHKKAAIAERDNNFSIQSAATPSQSHSTGIDQDGTDFSYFAEVTLGDKAKSLYMLLDTGAGTTWVMGPDCTSAACKVHNSFGPGDSSTFKAVEGDLDVAYGSGSIKGTYGSDSLTIAGLTIPMTIGIANSTSTQFSSFPMDGIIGLSKQAGEAPSFWESLVASKSLDANVFGVDLNRASDGPNTGEINFGAPDTSRYSGDLSYTSVNQNELGDWAIPIGNVGVGTKNAGITGKLAYIDSGTSWIFGPPADVATLHALIPGSATTDQSTYTVPCTTTDSATFTFSGVTYNISTKDWVGPEVNGACTSNIYGVAVVDKTSWLVGDTFLKNVYAVFDIDQGRVGLAAKKTASSPTSSVSSSTGAPTLSPATQSSNPNSPISPTQITGSSTFSKLTSNTPSSGSSTSSDSTQPVTATTSTSIVGLDGHETPKVTGTAVSETAAPSATIKHSGASHNTLTIAAPLSIFVLVFLL